MYKKILALMLSALMVVSLAGCSGGGDSAETTAAAAETTAAAADGETAAEGETAAAADGETFKIGAYLQLSGGNSAYGVEARNAIEIAIDYVNENGGFNGVPVELVAYDTQGSAEEAVKIVTKLIEVDQVDAAVGSINSSEVLAAAGYLNDAGIYNFGMGTSPTWMEEDWPYVFRAAMNNGNAVPATVELVQAFGYTSVGTFYGQDDNSLTTAETFEAACEEAGITVTASESYDTGDSDFSAQVASILASNPDCVYISVMGEAGPLIVQQLRQYGYSGIIIDKESFMESQIDIAGEENSNYIAFANPYVTYASSADCDDEYMKSFLERYEEAYGECCKTDSAYRGWDTIMCMWEASKIAGANDSDSLRDATNQISGLQGLGGTIDFTAGDREAYQTVNKFILVDRKNIPVDQWLEDGGYDAYKEATGNDK